MSTQQNEKVYVNGMFVKTQKTTFGDIIKISIKVEDVVNFLKDNSNNGWCDIDLLQKKQVDEKGRTHTAVLNTWKPNKTVIPNGPGGFDGGSDLPF